MLGVERGTVRGEGWEMDHIRFGAGGRVLVILPGLGDGLRTVRETALPLAAACREYGRERKVYLFSRRRGLEPGPPSAGGGGQAEAMKKLGLWGADVLGISQGGMVAQPPGGGGTGVGEAPRPGGDSRLGQRDGAGDRGALAAAGGTRGLPKADAGHSGALLLPAVFAAIPGCCCPCWAPSGGPGATSASSFRPEPASA